MSKAYATEGSARGSPGVVYGLWWWSVGLTMCSGLVCDGMVDHSFDMPGYVRFFSNWPRRIFGFPSEPI